MTSLWSLQAAGEERATATLVKEVQLCCKKFVLTLRSAVWLLTWPGNIKLDAGAGLPSSELHCPGSRREGGKHKQEKTTGKRRGETTRRNMETSQTHSSER